MGVQWGVIRLNYSETWGGHSKWGKGQDDGAGIDHPGRTDGSGSRTLRNSLKDLEAEGLREARSQPAL